MRFSRKSVDDRGMSNVLITGASSGIGKALANEYASRGHNLVLLARRGELLMSLKREIESEYRVRVMALAADVTDDASLNAAVQEARKALGSLDIVIANAGFGVHGCADDLSLKDFERQFDVNVFGVLRTFYATLADLKATRGRFCIIGSGCAYVTAPDSVAYSMSKHAVRSLAEGLYVALARYGVS
ncbi:MAG: SDR family NAD(P)-dependent oxidoreductase, partial [Planctomycetes bacterium]|nr:SDR family NAD(P)-dependent oxidoreductase [Planctomycetota bacterium]